MTTVEYNSLPEEESDYAIAPGIAEDDAHYDVINEEDIVVDYIGEELIAGDKVKFVIETIDGEEEYWIGYVTKITDFSADADDDGKWYGVTPDVIVEYSFLGTSEVTTFDTYQHTRKTNIFICDELELVKERN
jgi:hypothetical protein